MQHAMSKYMTCISLVKHCRTCTNTLLLCQLEYYGLQGRNPNTAVDIDSRCSLLLKQHACEQRRALLISCLSFSVISVFLGFSIWPMTDMMSCPPCGFAFAESRSCRVTSWTISFFLCTSPCTPTSCMPYTVLLPKNELFNAASCGIFC